ELQRLITIALAEALDDRTQLGNELEDHIVKVEALGHGSSPGKGPEMGPSHPLTTRVATAALITGRSTWPGGPQRDYAAIERDERGKRPGRRGTSSVSRRYPKRSRGLSPKKRWAAVVPSGRRNA